MMIAPSLFDDANGEYYGMDGQVHRAAAGQHNYSAYSTWDTFRALQSFLHALSAGTCASACEQPDRDVRTEPRRHGSVAAAR